MIVKMQKVLTVYSFRLGSSGVQQESVVGGRVKCHTVRSMLAVSPPSPKSTEQDMPLQEDWRFSRLLTCRISKRAGAEGTGVNTGQCLDRIYDGLDYIVEPYMKFSQSILEQILFFFNIYNKIFLLGSQYVNKYRYLWMKYKHLEHS
jgi:hypothetical protein